jgi:hypothetical protein
VLVEQQGAFKLQQQALETEKKSLDSLRSSHPVEVVVKDPNEVDQIFDAISYNKGGSVLRMLEQAMGEEAFRQGIQRFLEQNAFACATTPAAKQAPAKNGAKHEHSTYDRPGTGPFAKCEHYPKRIQDRLEERNQGRFERGHVFDGCGVKHIGQPELHGAEHEPAPDGAFESWSDTLPEMIGLDPVAMPRSALMRRAQRVSLRPRSLSGNVPAWFWCLTRPYSVPSSYDGTCYVWLRQPAQTAGLKR